MNCNIKRFNFFSKKAKVYFPMLIKFGIWEPPLSNLPECSPFCFYIMSPHQPRDQGKTISQRPGRAGCVLEPLGTPCSASPIFSYLATTLASLSLCGVATIDALDGAGSLGGLEEKCAPTCIYLNPWSLVGVLFGEAVKLLGSGILPEEVCH